MPDSAATATAIFSGVKANMRTMGVNGKVEYKNCSQSLDQNNQLSNILSWSQEAGKETG